MTDDTTPIRVAFDIDGCLYQWSEGVRAALIERGVPLHEADMEGTEWNHVRSVIGDEHWDWIFTEEGCLSSLTRPDLHYPGVPEALHRVSSIAEVTYITHRSASAAAATAQWLASHGAPFRSLHILGDPQGLHAPKSSVQPKQDLYIEDSPSNVKELLAETDAVVMCPRRPYNEDAFEAELELYDGRLILYTDIDEVVRFVEQLVEDWT